MPFKFILDPQAGGPQIESLVVNGDEVTIDGQTFNFAPLEEGAEIPVKYIDSPYISYRGDSPKEVVSRIDGLVVIRLLFGYTDPAPHSSRFPEPIEVTTNGPVNLPARSNAQEWT